MLILTRKIGETLNIRDDVNIMVIGVKGNQVHLGIHAVKSVSAFQRIERKFIFAYKRMVQYFTRKIMN